MTTLKEQIVGVWSLVSFVDQNQNGNTLYPLGEDAVGFIMYHPMGYMSAQLMKHGRAPYQSVMIRHSDARKILFHRMFHG